MKHQKLVRLLFVATFFLFVGNIQGQEKHVRQLKLDNGLTIILNEDHSKTEVFGMVVVNAGSKNDPKDATGMAHYQEHMLFKGTTELGTSNWEKEKPHIDRIITLYDELTKTSNDSLRTQIQKEINKESIEAGKYTILNEISNLIDQMGGTNLNAATGDDQTVYYNSFPPNQIEKWIELYSHRFEKPVFRAFQAELETVYEEKNMYQDNFISVMLEAFNKSFYKNHPYGQQTILGKTEHLKNPSLSKMYEFFHTYYVPNNMAVVLVGDFDSDSVLPLLKEKFGKWKRKELPDKKEYIEESFQGREEVIGKYSPIKMALLGFRTVPQGHPDELALSLFNGFLSNDKGTGVLDKLAQNGEVMAIEAIEMHNQDYGANLFLVVPKIIGQKLSTAEKLMMNAIVTARDGEIDQNMLDQAKKEMYVNFHLDLEDYEIRGNNLAILFMQGKDANELFQFPDRINAVSAEDVKRVAKKYYGDNYLAFYSKMGSPDKEKLAKPNYDPVSTDKKGKSSFAKRFTDIPSGEYTTKSVDFNKDIEQLDLLKNVKLHAVRNPKNDIYTTKIVFKVGNLKIKEANYVASLLNTAGTKEMTRDQLQEAFAQIGSSYKCEANGENVSITLTGIEKDFVTAVKLIGKLISSPVLDEKDMSTTAIIAISERKVEREDPANVAHDLLSYVAYGDKCISLNRMSKKKIKKFTSNDFDRVWSQIREYECDIHYAGRKKGTLVREILLNNMSFSKNPLPEDKSVLISLKKYNEKCIYFINRKDAIQSNIFFLANTGKFEKKRVPVQDAFNSYYGGGFSGLVLQEIREYRSLAYTAWAGCVSADRAGKNNYFLGMIGTQADKTLEAIKVFNDLKEDMPKMPERMSYIKPYLEQQSITAYPDFRHISEKVEGWKKLGYEKDPYHYTQKIIPELSFSEVYEFYEEMIKDKPMVIMIVGDKSKINMKELAKYGDIKMMKEKNLYTK